MYYLLSIIITRFMKFIHINQELHILSAHQRDRYSGPIYNKFYHYSDLKVKDFGVTIECYLRTAQLRNAALLLHIVNHCGRPAH